MRGELTGDQVSKLLTALKSIRPALSEDLIETIMDREQRVSLGPDLDFLDYDEICSLPGERARFEFDIGFDEDPDAACEREVNGMRAQGIELARAGGVIVSLVSPGGKYPQLSGVFQSIKKHLHRASAYGLGCFDGGASQGRISCLIIVAGIDTLEPFTFVGPEEDFSRRFERRNGFPPISEIPAFLRPKPGPGTN